MRKESLKKGTTYFVKNGMVYRYGLLADSKIENHTVNFSNELESYFSEVKFEGFLDKPRLIQGAWFNIIVSSYGFTIYTNSYFLSEGNKQQINENECANISEYIDQHLDEINKGIVNQYGGYFVYDSSEDEYDDLHCVEIKNGKPIFNTSEEYEKRLKQRFKNAISREKQIYGYRFKQNWDKEIIHMQIDEAIDKGNQEEFIRLSEKLKEMR